NRSGAGDLKERRSFGAATFVWARLPVVRPDNDLVDSPFAATIDQRKPTKRFIDRPVADGEGEAAVDHYSHLAIRIARPFHVMRGAVGEARHLGAARNCPGILTVTASTDSG